MLAVLGTVYKKMEKTKFHPQRTIQAGYNTVQYFTREIYSML